MGEWQTLLGMGLITRLPTADERQVVGDLSEGDWAEELRQIREFSPGLLTAAGIEFLGGDDKLAREMWGGINDARERENKTGRYAPLIKLDEMFQPKPGQEGTATEKQLVYLRNLGVREQETLLETLTKKEASELIDAVLKLREENGLSS